jgi:hypothetical protein
VPDENRWVHKHYHECSYLQGNEGNIDTLHVGFLHRFLPGSRFSPTMSSENRKVNTFERTLRAPNCEETHYGVRIYEFRDEDGATHLLTKNFVMPLTCAVGGGPSPTGDGYLMNWHVPIDDTHHWRYSMAFKRSGPIDPRYRAARESVTDEHYRFPRTKANRYLQDREEQKRDTFSGMGPVFVVQDSFATETAGPVQDRTQEHLAPSDGAIVATRVFMLRAIKDVQEGRDPPHVLRHPEDQDRLLDIDVIAEELPLGITLDEYRARRDGIAAVGVDGYHSSPLAAGEGCGEGEARPPELGVTPVSFGKAEPGGRRAS